MYIFNLLPHLGYLVLADEFLAILVKKSMARKVRIYWKGPVYRLVILYSLPRYHDYRVKVIYISINTQYLTLKLSCIEKYGNAYTVDGEYSTSAQPLYLPSDAEMEGRDPLGVSGTGRLAGRGREGMVIICFAHPFSSISPS